MERAELVQKANEYMAWMERKIDEEIADKKYDLAQTSYFILMGAASMAEQMGLKELGPVERRCAPIFCRILDAQYGSDEAES